MFKKKALTTAVQAAMVVSAATLMQGCNLAEEKSTSKVSGTFEHVKAPKGIVQGVVTDTNGSFMKGVKVVLGNKSTKTNYGGYYTFTGVAVASVAGLEGDERESLQVSVLPFEDKEGNQYTGAIVTVYPQAQIDDMDNDDAQTGDQTGNQVTTFIDGFTAQAGTAVVAERASTVTGVIRNSVTGEVVKGLPVALDLTNVGTGDSGQQGDHNGNDASHTAATVAAGDVIRAVTDDNGRFTFTNVPVDSELDLIAANWVKPGDGDACGVASGDSDLTSVNTDAELQIVNVGDVLACEIPSDDNIEPYVVSVSHLATPDNDILQRNVTGQEGIRITFSEPLDPPVDGEYPTIIYDTYNNVYVGNLATTLDPQDDRVLIVTTTEDIMDNAELEIHIARANINDLAGNNVVDGEADGGAKDEWPMDWISKAGLVGEGGDTDGSSNLVYLTIPLKAWKTENKDASAITGLVQLETDDTGSDQLPELVEQGLPYFNDVLDAMWDGDTDNDDIQQLNNQTNSFETEARLSLLVGEILGDTGVNVETDVARIRFTSSNALSYEVSLTSDGTDISDSASVTYQYSAGVTSLTGGDPDGTGDNDAYEFKASDDSVVEIAIAGVAPGDQVTIIPLDDLGYQGDILPPIDLLDNVEPTTGIQNAYGLWDHVYSDSNSYGDGGELSMVGSVNLTPTPNLNITFELLDDDCGSAATNLDCDNLDNELVAHNTTPEDVDLVGEDPYLIGEADIYDANAYQELADNLDRTIGVAFTENIVLETATGAAGVPTYDGTAGLVGNFVAENNVELQDDDDDSGEAATVGESDLVLFDTTNVLTLASEDGSIISFNGQVTDSAGNTASIANVVVKDRVFPLPTNATYNGDNITITFNEDVYLDRDDATISVALGAHTITPSVSTKDAHNAAANADKHILVIPRADWGDNFINGAATFALPAYAESVGGNVNRHGRLNTSEIRDLHGNRGVNGNVADGDVLGNMTFPEFAIKDLVGDMSVSVSAPLWEIGGTDTDGFVVTYNSNHVIDMAATFEACATTDATTITTATTALSGNDVADCFAITGTGTAIDATNSSATLTNNGKTLTVTVDADADLAATDTFDFTGNGGNMESLYDSADVANPDALPTL